MSQPQAEPISQGKLKILKAVATLLEDPAMRLTISRVARQISVTDAAIYRHYRSKEDIFAALIQYMESNFIAPLNQIQRQGSASHDDIRNLFNQFMEFLAGHPGLARLLLGQGNTEAPGISAKVQLLNAKLRSQLAQLLKWGQMKGDLSLHATPEQGAELIYGQLMTAAMAYVFTMPQLTTEERWETIELALFNKLPQAATA